MEKAVTEDTAQNDEKSLLDYLVVLAKYGRMIVLTSAAVTIIAYLNLFLSPNQYTSTARLLPPQQNLTLSAQLLDSLGGGVTPGGHAGMGMRGWGASLLGLSSPSEIYVGMLESDTIADRIIARFNLRKLYKLKDIETTRKALKSYVSINVSRKTSIITIRVTDESPIRAAEMANAFVEELENLLKKLALQEAKSRLVFLGKERAQASQNLTKAEEALRTFSEQNSVIQINTQTKSMLEYIASLRAEIDSREVQIQVLRQQATPSNYDMVRLETETKGLKEKLLNAEKRMGPTCIGDVCLNTSKVPKLGLEYIRLYREAKFQENLYQIYCKLMEIARLDMARNITIISLVDKALPPERRSNSRLLPSIMVGMGTFFIMIIVAFSLEHWQNMQKSEDEAQRLSIIINYLKPRGELLKKRNLPIFKKFFKAKCDQD
jgi:tyrosine-protein kinase Etk/Wzc